MVRKHSRFGLRHAGCLANSKRRGCECERFASMIIKGPDAEMVTGTEQSLVGRVPDCKCKVPQQVQHAIFTPFAIGREDQMAVRQKFHGSAIYVERGNQVRAIINSGIGDNNEAADGILPGQSFMQGFRRAVEHQMAEAS